MFTFTRENTPTRIKIYITIMTTFLHKSLLSFLAFASFLFIGNYSFGQSPEILLVVHLEIGLFLVALLQFRYKFGVAAPEVVVLKKILVLLVVAVQEHIQRLQLELPLEIRMHMMSVQAVQVVLGMERVVTGFHLLFQGLE